MFFLCREAPILVQFLFSVKGIHLPVFNSTGLGVCQGLLCLPRAVPGIARRCPFLYPGPELLLTRMMLLPPPSSKRLRERQAPHTCEATSLPLRLQPFPTCTILTNKGHFRRCPLHPTHHPSRKQILGSVPVPELPIMMT